MTKKVNFFEEKVHPGDLAPERSDLKMTWLLPPLFIPTGSSQPWRIWLPRLFQHYIRCWYIT